MADRVKEWLATRIIVRTIVNDNDGSCMEFAWKALGKKARKHADT